MLKLGESKVVITAWILDSTKFTVCPSLKTFWFL